MTVVVAISSYKTCWVSETRCLFSQLYEIHRLSLIEVMWSVRTFAEVAVNIVLCRSVAGQLVYIFSLCHGVACIYFKIIFSIDEIVILTASPVSHICWIKQFSVLYSLRVLFPASVQFQDLSQNCLKLAHNPLISLSYFLLHITVFYLLVYS